MRLNGRESERAGVVGEVAECMVARKARRSVASIVGLCSVSLSGPSIQSDVIYWSTSCDFIAN